MARSTPERPGTGEHVAQAARWSGQLSGRIARAWPRLGHEQRLAAGAAAGLFLTLFLPWYQETVLTERVRIPVSASLSGWAAFSWVEAAVLLVAAGVLLLLFHRAEGHPFHLPGGDGFVILAAGVWAAALVLWRVFDKQSTTVRGPGIVTTGIEWGIFVALALAALLAYAGTRIRAAHQPEPRLPGEDDEAMTLWEVPEPRSRDERRLAAEARAERRPEGWLSARPRHLDEDPTAVVGDQLTIPLEDR